MMSSQVKLGLAEFSTDELLAKILYIQNSVDENFKLILNEAWGARHADYRLKIRKTMGEKFTSYFNREQLALLHDLNWLPMAQEAYFSISHCHEMGGFSFSKLRHGFDVEEIKRISTNILSRTCHEDEMKACPRAEFLWVAKEAGVKSLSNDFGHTKSSKTLLVTDLTAFDWQSHFENRVFSFRLKSEKALAFEINKGFIFFEGDKLFCIHFR